MLIIIIFSEDSKKFLPKHSVPLINGKKANANKVFLVHEK